jgi:hypothetical protein
MSKNVFILGSGFSKDLVGLPTLKELSENVIDFFDKHVDEQAEKEEAPNNHYVAVSEYIADHISQDVQYNIEHLMTLLRSSNPWLKKSDAILRQSLFATLSEVVAMLIKDKESSAVSPPKHFDNLLKNWMDSSSAVVTFNYDTVVEKRASELFSTEHDTIPSQDFYVGPFSNLASRTHSIIAGETPEKIFRLIKLHGSTSWYYSGNESFSGEPIYVDPLFRKGSGQSIADENKVDLVPLIVPPLLDKDPFMKHSILKLQWQKAFEALSSADNIYVIGYSLPETDLTPRFMLQETKLFSKAN